MIREIVTEDLPRIRSLLEKKFPDGTYVEIERLGGMTNRSYKITRQDGKEYLIRIPGKGTQELINRTDERKSEELACRLGIDAGLLYFGNDGTKIMDFIPHPKEINAQVLQKKEYMLQAARIFQKLHTCGEDTRVPFEVFETARRYEEIIRSHHIALFADYENIKQITADIKASLDAAGIVPKVPCHNDPLTDNWVIRGDGTLFLVDWEYAGMNEAMWDLSCFSIEANYSAENDEEFLSFYYGRKASAEERRSFIATKIYVDYLWTLWGLTRVPYDRNFMQQYAEMRYTRLKENIAAYKTMGLASTS